MATEKVGNDEHAFDVTSLRHWVIAFVVCNFNVDLGPELELIYPETPLSVSDSTAICFNAFPERQVSHPSSDLFFHFKIRNDSPDVALASPHEPHGSADALYGYCIFHQEPDKRSKRKYEQKSVVLVTNHCFSAFNIRLLRLLAPNVFLDPIPTLEAACNQIARWPAPARGEQQLPFMGTLLTAMTAPSASFALQGLGLSGSLGAYTSPVHVYAPETPWDVLLPYLPSLAELYTIYERALLCEPLIFLSNSPQLCSEFVSATIDLVRPVPCVGDIRPYLTMQSVFCSSSLDGGLPHHYITGVTNPFLLSRILTLAATAGRTIPHVVHLRDTPASPVPLRPAHKNLTGSPKHSNPISDLPGMARHAASSPPKTYLQKDSEHFLKPLHTHSAFLSSPFPSTSHTSPSPKATPTSTSVDIDIQIRRHFTQKTASFLSPLNRYFATLLPSNTTPLSPGGTHLQYAHFAHAAFQRSLDKYGAAGIAFKGHTPLARRRARDAFYGKFVTSPSFYSWLETKIVLERDAIATTSTLEKRLEC